jgi:carbon storage regulator CsrA
VVECLKAFRHAGFFWLPVENGGSVMLVLSRKSQESVVVGGADAFHRLLKITVLAIQGDKVKLGFEVDTEVPVYRLEIWERMLANGELHRPRAGPLKPEFGSN